MDNYKIYKEQQKIKNQRAHDLNKNNPVKEVQNIPLKKSIRPVLSVGLKLNRIINGYSINIDGKQNIPIDNKRPIIFAPSHIGKFDVEIIGEAINKHFYLLSGDFMNLHPDIGGKLLEKNGIVYFDMYDKKDRSNVKKVILQVLNKGCNFIWFPEGTWNFSENEIVQPCYYYMVEAAALTNALIVPIGIEQYDKHFDILVGEPYDVRKEYGKVNLSNEDKIDSIGVLRDKISTLKWNIWESQGISKRSELDYNDWKEFINERLKEWPGFSYHEVVSKKFRDKDIITNEEAFEHMDIVKINKQNIYLLNKHNTGIKK